MKRGHALAASLIFLALTVFPLAAKAQEHGGGPSEAAPFGSPVEDQYVWVHAMLEQFEGRFGSENALVWDAEAWTGTDTHRLWLKSEGELRDGEVENGQHEILYDRPISTYFDLQAGLRYDLDSRASRGWAAFGVEGIAPYFFHVSATAYASDRGHFAARLAGTYDLLITQRLILQPDIELNLYSKADPKRLVGSGLSEIDLGLRLRHEIVRKFAPYIGITYEKKFGGTGTYAAAAGEKTDALRVAVGVRSWF
jgi:copper resistance protein B